VRARACQHVSVCDCCIEKTKHFLDVILQTIYNISLSRKISLSRSLPAFDFCALSSRRTRYSSARHASRIFFLSLHAPMNLRKGWHTWHSCSPRIAASQVGCKCSESGGCIARGKYAGNRYNKSGPCSLCYTSLKVCNTLCKSPSRSVVHYMFLVFEIDCV
jgi:hypothetical protein